MGNTIRVEKVRKIFSLGVTGRKKIVALNEIDLEIRGKEIVGVLGESGSGKSTLAKIILRLEKPTEGRVMLGDIDIWSIREWRRIKDYYGKVQGVFQDPYASFNPRRTLLSILYDTVYNYFPEYRKDPRRAREYIQGVLSSVGLDMNRIEGRYPHQLSGGQLQRVAIARSLLTNPEFIVADEPVSMLDASLRIDILNIFIDLKESRGVTSVIIGHDYSLAYYVSDRIVVLYRGEIVEEGSVEVLEEPSHPYTKMLKSSVPLIDRKWGRESLAMTPTVAEKPEHQGCIYADRCPLKMPICERQKPPVIDLGKARVKCWLYTSG